MCASTNSGEACPTPPIGETVAGPAAAKAAHIQHRALLWRAQRMTFWVIYDHLGRFITLNIVSLLLIVTPLWIGMEWGGIPAVILWSVAAVFGCVMTVGQAHLVTALIAGETFDYRQVGVGIRRFGVSAVVLGACLVLALVSSGMGVWFYGSVVSGKHPLIGAIMAELSICAGAVVLMVAFYAVPALVAQRGSPLRALRTSMMLVVCHPMVSVGFLVTVVAYSVFMVTPPGCALLSTLPLVTLASCGYELLARHHDPALALPDDEDDYLNRGFRDFLFPWKG